MLARCTLFQAARVSFEQLSDLWRCSTGQQTGRSWCTGALPGAPSAASKPSSCSSLRSSCKASACDQEHLLLVRRGEPSLALGWLKEAGSRCNAGLTCDGVHKSSEPAAPDVTPNNFSRMALGMIATRTELQIVCQVAQSSNSSSSGGSGISSRWSYKGCQPASRRLVPYGGGRVYVVESLSIRQR